MIHIAVVDDEKSYISQIQQYLEQFERESGETIKVSVFSDGDSIVHKYNSEYDIIFMDVEMKFMDGMSAAEEIRKKGFRGSYYFHYQYASICHTWICR